MEKDNFKYYAFISYSHADKIIAQKLQSFLQSYHLPSDLQNSYPDLPKNLKPIFIDESNLVGTVLQKSLQKNLDKSKYLIVICSPNSAKSKYVNQEVAHFIEIGRIDRIIPLIIDGNPHAEDPSDECFPPAILAIEEKDELLGISFKNFGERDSFLRVIATMLGLDLDNFVSWEDRERKRRRKKKIMIFTPIAASLTVIAGWLVWYNIPHHRYYHTYVYKWEKPVGLFEVTSESDRKKMEYTYRFTTLRGKVQMIERINSAGILVNSAINTPLIELPMICFVSDRTVEYYDLYRHKVYRKEYTKDMQAVDFYCGDSTVPYAIPEDTDAAYNYDIDFGFGYSSGSITRLTMEYDNDGYVVKQVFRNGNRGGKDKKGTPAQSRSGIWGASYKLDNMGRVTEVHTLDKKGEAMSIHGVYAWRIEYGDKPYPVKISYVDKNGNLASGNEGTAFTTIVYDKYFNVERRSYYDSNGKRVLNNNNNVSEEVCTHDADNGFLTSVSYYDVDLAPCLCKNGYFREECIRDKEGRESVTSFYDVKGKRTILSDGYASYNVEYNDEGRMSSMTFMDTENKSTIDSSNVYGYRFSYENGFLVRTNYIDSKGNLMLNKNGVASEIQVYDKEENKVIGVINYDTEGKRVLNSYGVAEMRITYDDGNISSVSSYDENGRPKTGVARYIHEWRNGNRISTKWFDAGNKLTSNAKGYAIEEHEYDENGSVIWDRYYDADGKRVIPSSGYSAVKYARNNRGDITRIDYYGTDDNYIIKPNDYYCYAKEYSYDDKGNVTNIRYIREENSQYQDMLDKQVKDIYIEYDNRGNETKRYWLNGKGEEVDSSGNTNGNVKREKEYDIYGRLSRESWYGKGEGKARTTKEYEYDSFGRVISTSTIRYAGDKKEILTEKKEYDKYGRCCKTYYLNGENDLTVQGGNFYAIKKVRHNMFGYETDIWYYDEKGEPLHQENHAFHTVRTYDVKGNILTESYYSDENENEPIEISREIYKISEQSYKTDKIHKIARQYDVFRHETEYWLYDKSGNLVQRENTACHIVKSYNSLGQNISIETYGADGKPFLDVDIGAFKIVFAYDSYGNRSDVWGFDANGVPCKLIHEGKAGQHHFKCSYDFMGHPLSIEVFDTEEKPCPMENVGDDEMDGVQKILATYNSYGLRTEVAYYDEEQNLLRRKLITYDSDGNKTGEEWVK